MKITAEKSVVLNVGLSVEEVQYLLDIHGETSIFGLKDQGVSEKAAYFSGEFYSALKEAAEKEGITV